MLIDARFLNLIGLCTHWGHRHIGAYGGRCRFCRAMWCTLTAYDCELIH